MSRPKPLKQEQTLQYLRDGWELGSGANGPNPHHWMQRKLMCGGDTFNVHAGSFHALFKKKLIEPFNKKGDPFWLTRWRLKAAK